MAEKNEKKTNEQKAAIKAPFIELPLQALKVRRNLLTFSIMTLIVVKFGNMTWTPTGLGLTGPKLSGCSINLSLLTITLYFLIYFAFLGHQTQQRWKLRMTGISLDELVNQGVALEGAIQTDESLKQQTSMDYIVKKTDGILKRLNELQKIPLGNQGTQGLTVAINNLETSFASYKIDKTKLEYVTHSFFRYQGSYKINWILEYALPVSLGAAAVISMLIHIFWGPIYWPWLTKLSPC